MQPDEFQRRLKGLKRRGRIRTSYDPTEFTNLYQAAPGTEAEGEVRELFREIDSGRWHSFLDEAHNVLSKSDLKRREAFVENYSDRLILWIKAYGHIEELNKFPNIEV